jgi:hypothetical protein
MRNSSSSKLGINLLIRFGVISGSLYVLWYNYVLEEAASVVCDYKLRKILVVETFTVRFGDISPTGSQQGCKSSA